MSGGSSKSSSSQSTATTQIDKRIGATDQAIVVQAEGGSTITLTDNGVVDAAKTMFGDALDYSSETYAKGIEALTNFGATAIGAVNKANESAYKAVDTLRQNADQQNYKSTIQWLAIVSIAAFVAWGYRGK